MRSAKPPPRGLAEPASPTRMDCLTGGENIDHLGSRNRAPARDPLCPGGRSRQIDGVLIEVGVCRRLRGAGASARRLLSAISSLSTELRRSRGSLSERVGLNLLQLFTDLAHNPRSSSSETTQDGSRCGCGWTRSRSSRWSSCVNIFSSDGSMPRACVAGFEFVEAARQLRRQARLVDANCFRMKAKSPSLESSSSSGNARFRRHSGSGTSRIPRKPPAPGAPNRSVSR